ncbi:DUF924 family protein [Coleofasciculus sp. FACHB-SPT9]|uniref:DUF924 family protein n=1 Tax=Cyanophyceae TaxID=3028117 RepID=UPI00168910D1|nr:DUF924 family protein [Coleofasciculus sp. FACHB-SPT9]MBD1891889.1 DUF924 domain-containing protein [Coleofasciculus sp. FACHB-SPT9]
MSQVHEILNFWFGKPDEAGYGKPRKVWFTKKPQFDEEIRTRFLGDYELAAAGQLNPWKESPQSCLALILLLDQFPRNLFRGSAQAFATDSLAMSAAQHAVANGFDRELLPVQRCFFYLPFEHSENLEHQRQSVELFQQLGDDPDCIDYISYAVRHFEVIERFGRFPHRNQILGRETTTQEAEFLQQPGSSF